MFTGIITDVGRVLAVHGCESTGFTYDIFTKLPHQDLAVGASVACAGVCLTVTKQPEESDGGWIFSVDVSPETFSVTALKSWHTGQLVNLEAALRVGDALGGHWVSGHVDGVGSVRQKAPMDSGHQRWTIACPSNLMGLIADRGAVAVDGCSLTVVEVLADAFVLSMIPHTQMQTSFAHRVVGDAVHIEVDILARYITRWNDHSSS